MTDKIKKETRGGARKGSGRKPLSKEGKTRQASISLLPDEYEALQSLRRRGVNTNRLIGGALKEEYTRRWMNEFLESGGSSVPD